MAPILSPIRAVVFDVYGTLAEIRDRRSPFKQLLRYAQEQGRQPQPDDGALIMSYPGGLAEAAHRLGILPPLEVQTMLEAELAAELASIRLFDDVNATLADLKKRGFKLALCSNLAEPYAAPILALLDTTLDCYAWSFEVGTIKPDPKIYSYVLRHLGRSAEDVLFVGDSAEADLAGPTQIGMQTWLIDQDKPTSLQKVVNTLINSPNLTF